MGIEPTIKVVQNMLILCCLSLPNLNHFGRLSHPPDLLLTLRKYSQQR
uniref:Uncharacterized protein n=1 Tax=Podoviridae sp. ctZkC8 TaxID=2825259 RepID=A0A8S5UBX0_9CAUD|nr:MAG TPA: hypothetical protein [Podoviridae sp. ctZkC8]